MYIYIYTYIHIYIYIYMYIPPGRLAHPTPPHPTKKGWGWGHSAKYVLEHQRGSSHFWPWVSILKQRKASAEGRCGHVCVDVSFVELVPFLVSIESKAAGNRRWRRFSS